MLNISRKKSVIKAVAPISADTSSPTIGPDRENQPKPADSIRLWPNEYGVRREKAKPAAAVAVAANRGSRNTRRFRPPRRTCTKSVPTKKISRYRTCVLPITPSKVPCGNRR